MKPKISIRPSPAIIHRIERISRVFKRYSIQTICELDRCPNLFECWAQGSITIAILGSRCTRVCPFCAIDKSRVGDPIDPSEPKRIAEAVRNLGLTHIVLSSVTRDDLPDHGSTQYEAVIREIRNASPKTIIEVLIPDFMGDEEAIKRVVRAGPHIVGHNIETVNRLHPKIKPGGSYARSLRVLRLSKEFGARYTKSSIVLGFGETLDEVIETMRDLRRVGVDILVIGGYAPPSKYSLSPEKVDKRVFEKLRKLGLDMGFKAVSSHSLARSSFLSSRLFNLLLNNYY